MIKSLGKLTLATILAAVVIGMPLAVTAQTNSTNAGSMSSKPKAMPFHGKVASVDATAQTLTLEGKAKSTYYVTADTQIKKADVKAMFSDVTVGAEVRGSYYKDSTGKMTAKLLIIGAKSAAAPTAPVAPAVK